MALRGHRKKFSTADEGANIRNFLALLKLLAEYDLLNANHLQHAKENSGSVSYLSPDIQNEFINLLACTVRDKLLTRIKRIESIYLFFSRSTLRWEQLKNAVKFIVKREAETRWSAKAEVVKAISERVAELVELLESLSDNISQTMDTRNEAGTLLQDILQFSYIVLFHFWNNILGKADRIQKRLQDPNFKDAASNMEMLENYLKEFRDHLCKNAIEYSKGRCIEWGIEVERRVRRRRIMPGERAGDRGHSAEDEVSRVLKMVFDCFQQELTTRFRRLNDLNKKFGFLLDVRILLKKDGDESLQQHCLDLGNFYRRLTGVKILDSKKTCLCWLGCSILESASDFEPSLYSSDEEVSTSSDSGNKNLSEFELKIMLRDRAI
ncbi:uncharacterized protein LOC136082530 [Hydra vulgaris]|uniref:Uncharacterized protein LOC136082530 n=1 Tax=Hydra vulgaris TaxID=6087 RepID=A0ABM4C8R9_HYDVU